MERMPYTPRTRTLVDGTTILHIAVIIIIIVSIIFKLIIIVVFEIRMLIDVLAVHCCLRKPEDQQQLSASR
jgi:hypothetical protein